MADDELCNFNNNNNKPPLIFPTLFFYIFSHPLYFSYFLFFSPYFFKLISLFSPLFFTTSLLLLLSVIATAFPASNKLGLIQAVVDHVRAKLNAVGDEEEELEVCDFEDFEIYKIVFRDVVTTSSLLITGDGDGDAMEVVVGKLDEEKRLERLFEELDRFEDFRDVIEVKEVESSSDLVEFVGELRKSEAVEKLGGESMAELEKFGGKSMAVTSEKLGGISMAEMERFGGESTAVTTEMEKIGAKSMAVAEAVKKFGGKSMAVTTEMQKFGAKSTAVTAETEKIGAKSTAVTAETEKLGGKSTAVTSEKLVGKSMAEKQKLRGKSMAEMEKLLCGKSMAVTVETEKLSVKSTALTAEETTVSGEDEKTVTDPLFVRSNSLRLDSCSSFGSYGSMRKEKEWKRTLACKLFEERHNNSEGGEEGMDSLWEVHDHETDNNSAINKSLKKKNNKKDAMVKHKKSLTKAKDEFKYFDGEEEEEEDDDDEFMMSNGQLCCLKALKLSAGKMNLGMGKPNLVKISKALKGFGWLHHVGTKNGKRV